MAKQQIEGKVVAITGAARGIGKATAQALVAKGAKVAIGDIELALADQTAAELGGGTVALEVDVTDRDSFDRFLSAVEERLGPLDVLINNAGIMPVGPFAEEPDALSEKIIDIDVHGVIYGSKLAAKRMIPRGRGHVINIASQAGNAGIPHLATYCAAKFAVRGLSEALRGEWRDAGIEVSCVMPAIVNTELSSGITPARGVKNAEPEEVADAIVAAIIKPRHDVHVPRSTGVINKIVMIFPRGAREAIGKAMRVDKVMIEVDEQARKAYEDRVSGETRDFAAEHPRQQAAAKQKEKV